MQQFLSEAWFSVHWASSCLAARKDAKQLNEQKRAAQAAKEAEIIEDESEADKK